MIPKFIEFYLKKDESSREPRWCLWISSGDEFSDWVLKEWRKKPTTNTVEELISDVQRALTYVSRWECHQLNNGFFQVIYNKEYGATKAEGE